MDAQQELEALQQEVMKKAAAHLKAVTALPDDKPPTMKELEEAQRTREEWQAAMKAMNLLLEELLRQKFMK